VEFEPPTSEHEGMLGEITSSGGACQKIYILNFLGRGTQ